MNLENAGKFIYRNARPLDLARWQYFFEDGSKENVLKALSVYQNEDGGFGHALEADSWNPKSSPIQTWSATQIIREVKLEDKNHPMVLEILHYLENTNDFDGHSWSNTVPTNDQYPHAPWWNYVPTETINYNPTTSLIGFILRYAAEESKIYQMAQKLLQEAYAYFKENCPLESMHTVSGFVELYEDLVACNLDLVNLKEFQELLHVQLDHVLTKDTSLWEIEYVCKPSLFIHSKQSNFYEKNKELCEFEREFISNTQKEDGTWEVTWDWGDYPEQWHISKNWWKADIILKNALYYKMMK